MTKIIPALYVNITERCNMRCEYCPVYGENWEASEQLLELSQVLKVVSAASRAGVLTYRISGGEPFLLPDRVLEILDHMNNLGQDDIILNTNGFNFAKYAAQVSSFYINKLKISLDTLDPDLFYRVTGSRKLPDVIAGIDAALEEGITTELNTVVTRTNVDELPRLIDFCIDRGLSLKLLDLVMYDELVRKNLDPGRYWKQEFVPLGELSAELERRFGEPTVARLSSGRGIPMMRFNLGGSLSLTLKDSTVGSTYGEVCRDCKHFPCQEGLFHLSLSAAGNLAPCRLRRDLGVDVEDLSDVDLEEVISKQLEAYSSPFVSRGFYSESEFEERGVRE